MNIIDRKLILQIWDLSGKERYRFLLSSYCRGKRGAIILYDIMNSRTLNHIPDWIQMIRENTGDIPILLVGNLYHLEKSREASRKKGIKIIEKYNLSGFIKISTKTGLNVEKMFEDLTEIIIKKTFKALSNLIFQREEENEKK